MVMVVQYIGRRRGQRDREASPSPAELWAGPGPAGVAYQLVWRPAAAAASFPQADLLRVFPNARASGPSHSGIFLECLLDWHTAIDDNRHLLTASYIPIYLLKRHFLAPRWKIANM